MAETLVVMECKFCHHQLTDNQHGFDQNDAWLEGDKLVHSGTCTYCRFCNPRIAQYTGGFWG